jgi:hypothetical protein
MSIKLVLASIFAALAFASTPAAGGPSAQMTITVEPAPHAAAAPPALTPADLTVLERDARAPVIRLDRLPADQADMQLFVVMDDSTRSSSLGLQLPDLKKWVDSLPPGAQVAIGYIHNGAAQMRQPFTTDHTRAGAALRLPESVPGVNGSPYFSVSNLARHWPSNDLSAHRILLFFTDGVDRYYDDPQIIDDPYVDAAVDSAMRNRLTIYTVYLRGAGRYGEGPWGTTVAQSRLLQVSNETGGCSYQEDFTDPVTIAPFLKNLSARLSNQYRVTFQALNGSGFQPVKLRTELPGVKIDFPQRVYVP